MLPGLMVKEMSDSLLTVLDDSNTFQRGVRRVFKDSDITDTSCRVSITLTDQGDYYDAYVVVDETETEYAKQVVQELEEFLTAEDSVGPVSTQRDNRWCESTFQVDTNQLERFR